jgi:DNA-binding SARP family transcriptional activator
MQIGVLGPLVVTHDGHPVVVAGARLRSLLVRLAVEPGRAVSISELAAAVWGDDLPADPANALQSLVSRLRRVLGQPGVVSQQPSGYRLEISRHDLDATAFVELVTGARELLRGGELDAAADALREALGMWRTSASTPRRT